MKTSKIILISGGVVIASTLAVLWYRRNSFTKRLIQIAIQEVKRWQGLTETAPKASVLLQKYWRSVGYNFSTQNLQSASFQASWPWSSAGISWLFFRAGAKDKFPYSASHTTYFQFAKANRNNPNASLQGFRINEYRPKEGDLVVFSNELGKGYDTPGWFKSHGELVTKVGQGFIEAAGANVSNTFKISRYSTQNGFLTKRERDFFMVIKNNIR